MAKQTKKRFRKSKRKQSRSVKARNKKYRTTMKCRRRGRVVMQGGAPGDNKYVFMGEELRSTKDEILLSIGSIKKLSDEEIEQMISAMEPAQTAYIYSGYGLTLTLPEEQKSNIAQQVIRRQMIRGPGTLRIVSKNPEVTTQNSTITGTFQNGEVNGQGTVVWSDGDKYEGHIKSNEANGEGTFFYTGTYPGNQVTGQFENKLIIKGKGFLPLRKEGHSYVGEIERGLMHGKGTYYTPTVEEKGTFDNHNKEGEFTCTEKVGGGIWEVTYRNNVCQGEFTYKIPDKSICKGTFIDGKSHGKSTITYSNGIVYEQTYANGKMINQKLVSPAPALVPVPVPAQEQAPALVPVQAPAQGPPPAPETSRWSWKRIKKSFSKLFSRHPTETGEREQLLRVQETADV